MVFISFSLYQFTVTNQMLYGTVADILSKMLN